MDEFLKTTKNAGHIEELKRLTTNHYVWKEGMGKLVFAPIDLPKPNLRILDSATADGTWLRDLGCSGELVGTDIEPELFPHDLPANMKLFKQNMNEPWPGEWNSSFDLVHQRLGLAGTAGSDSGPDKVVQNLASLVKPGGWLQLVEMNIFGAPKFGPAHNDVISLLQGVFSGIGLGDVAQNMKPLMDRAGLVNIQEGRFNCPIGAKAKPYLREDSIAALSSSVAPLVAVAKSLPISLTAEELETLPSRIEEEIRNQGSEYEMIVVWGQKK